MIDPDVTPVRITSYTSMTVTGTLIPAFNICCSQDIQDPDITNLAVILHFQESGWIILYWPDAPTDNKYFQSDRLLPVEDKKIVVHSLPKHEFQWPEIEKINSYLDKINLQSTEREANDLQLRTPESFPNG